MGCSNRAWMADARRLLGLALVVVAITGGTARAETFDDDGEDDAPPRWRIAVFEAAFVLALPTYFYYTSDENVDIELGWDWSSWKDKLTFDAVRFDTNRFVVNAFRHPLMSTIDYHIARTNDFGMLGSTAFAAVNGIIWEYIAEYCEYPSINDLIINAFTGVQIGEPLYQIGQLWRGGVLTPSDRLKTTLFSPLDAMHDVFRRRHVRWWRPRAWRSMLFEIGAARRELDDHDSHDEVMLVGDIDIVRDPRYLLPGPRRFAIKPGTWSRIRGRLRIGDLDDEIDITGVQLQTRTAFTGLYVQDDSGNGALGSIGAAFTYRRERLAHRWDHLAITHIAGPQIQLSHRAPELTLRFDAAAYAGFALVDAHVFDETRPFPRPPPYVSSVQAGGYYPGIALSATIRLRMQLRGWNSDAELDAHRTWQIDVADRVKREELSSSEPVTANDLSDRRLYWRASLGYASGRAGVAVTAEGSHRRGSWQALERSTSERAFGLLVQWNL